MKVVIKPTEFKQDEILLNAYSKGGLSQVATEDLPSAMFAVDVVENNGLGKFSSVNLRKALTGKSIGITPSIDDYSEGFTGNSSVKDFETLLQLVYLYFTAPRQDDEAFASLKSIYHSSLVNYDANPKSAFNDSIQMTATCHSPRTILVHADILDKVDQATALRIFQERFSNIADFTFFFTGNINPDDKATQEMICQWLGGLKTKKSREERIDNNIRSPKGKVNNYFNREMEIHTASNRIMYTGNMEYNLNNFLNMRIIGEILSTRYLESIREKEGGSYGVGVAGYMERFPENKAVLLMQFDTDPEKQEKLMDIIHQEIMTIVENGPLASDLSKTKEIYLKEFKQNVADNQDWSNIFLPRYYLYGENYLADYEKAVEQLADTQIKSPIDGTVVRVNTKVGRFADKTENDEPIFIIENLEVLEMEIPVSEYSIGKVAVGQPADITADILDGETVEGQVVSISPTGEERGGGSTERVIPTTIRITDSDTKLIAGITARAEILLETAKDALSVPASAIFSNGGGDYVQVVENGAVHWVPVTTGVEGNVDIQVTPAEGEHLDESSQVVAAPNASYAEGMAAVPLMQ